MPKRVSPSPGKEAPLGPWGEDRVLALLRRKGYRLVARNARVEGVEIDLLLRKGRTWLVVEVKTGSGEPESRLRPRQRARLHRAVACLQERLKPRPRRVDLLLAAVRLSASEPPEICFFALPPEPA